MKRMIRTPLVRLVDDDDAFRESQREFLKAMGWQVEDYAGAADLLERDDLSRPGCLVLDIRMPGMTGVELQRRLFDAKCTLPVIFLTGHGDITTAVHTMKYGAADFLEKRGDPLALAGAVERACAKSMAAESDAAEADDYRRTFESLTQREREVFMLAAEGFTNKDVAERLGIGAETVKMHKANAYAKLGVASALDAYRWLENLPADYRAGLAGTKDTRGGVMTQRRRLLAGAGLAAAVPGRLLAAGAPDTLDPGASGVWDVIVAGSGAAGLSAAAAALESGAGRVLVLEKGPLVGGHSIYSSGSVSAVAPSRSHDPNDTLGRFVEDALEVGGGTGDAAVLAKIGEDSAGVLDWLESLGVFWSEPFIAYSGKQAKSYAMPGNSAGRSYVLALMAHLRRFGCRLALSTPVTGFRPEGHAWVVEVNLPQGARTLRTRSLVIACGGFTANVEARMKINPLLTPDVPTSANPAGTVFDGATGELIECAGRNGAFVTTGFGLQALPFWGGRLLDYQGADIYVDMHGRRFVNENSPWNVISNAILSLPERRCWVITDDRSFKGATLGVKLINGVVRKSDSIDAMAAAMDIEPVVLARTIEDYNRAADKGYDARTGKRLFRQRIERPPFYWGAERIYVHTTLDGIRTNRAAEVIASSGGLVPGLYAAGECAGGIFGGDRLGGAGMTACFVMGREAGRQAAARAKELKAAA